MTNRLLVVLFASVISLPLMVTLAGVDGADSAAENRELAPFPRLAGGLDGPRAYATGLLAWFEDHFAFRARMVRWDAEIRYFALRTSPSTAVALGRDGWLFYADDGGIDDFANAKAMGAKGVARWRNVVVRTRDWSHAKGIVYLFTIAPDKHVIYPEQFTASVRRVGPVSRTDQVFAALADTGASVDPRAAALAARAEERLYHLTDTHWNARGAFVAYQTIIEALRRRMPAVPAPWARSDFDPSSRSVAGLDLAGMMGLTRVLHEEDLGLIPKRPRRAIVVDPPGAVPTAALGRLVTEIPGSNLPRAVVFRDSFGSELVPFLSEHFSRVVYLWQNDFDAEAVLRERADVVIQEIVGRHLYTFIPSPELVPDVASRPSE